MWTLRRARGVPHSLDLNSPTILCCRCGQGTSERSFSLGSLGSGGHQTNTGGLQLALASAQGRASERDTHFPTRETQSGLSRSARPGHQYSTRKLLKTPTRGRRECMTAHKRPNCGRTLGTNQPDGKRLERRVKERAGNSHFPLSATSMHSCKFSHSASFISCFSCSIHCTHTPPHRALILLFSYHAVLPALLVFLAFAYLVWRL